MRIHTGEKPYKCAHCDKVFSSTNNLQKHLRLHTKEKPYSCNQCDKAFTQNNSLVFHMRSHAGKSKNSIPGHIVEKPCICFNCDKSFFAFSKLSFNPFSCHCLTNCAFVIFLVAMSYRGWRIWAGVSPLRLGRHRR